MFQEFKTHWLPIAYSLAILPLFLKILFRLFYMLCSYSICSVYKNNGNIQNALNISTYVENLER